MATVKIAFFDIDGTLFDPQTGRIPGKTVQTLKALQAKGIRMMTTK